VFTRLRILRSEAISRRLEKREKKNIIKFCIAADTREMKLKSWEMDGEVETVATRRNITTLWHHTLPAIAGS
jgi:hypothetical protein